MKESEKQVGTNSLFGVFSFFYSRHLNVSFRTIILLSLFLCKILAKSMFWLHFCFLKYLW